LPSNVAVKVN